MTKRQSETEPATKTVAEVAHARGRCAAMVRFKRLNCRQGHSSGALLLPGRRAREIAGYVGLRSEVKAENPVIMGVLTTCRYVALFCRWETLAGARDRGTSRIR